MAKAKKDKPDEIEPVEPEQAAEQAEPVEPEQAAEQAEPVEPEQTAEQAQPAPPDPVESAQQAQAGPLYRDTYAEQAEPVEPEPLEGRGQHGLQREPQDATSLTRLCRLLELSTEVSLTTVLREAADTIEELRKE